MIVIAHAVYLVTTPLLLSIITVLSSCLVIFCLSLFFFISGFVLYFSHDGIKTAADTLAFWKKRVIRIYPLYWLALILFFVLVSYNIGPLNIDISFKGMLIQLLCLQALLGPRFINPVYTLCFVGVILIFYLVYPLIVYPSGDGTHLILASCAVLLPFVVMRLAFNIIDFRFFIYYGIFVAGILASIYEVIYKLSPPPRFFLHWC
jgi:peptidoglycan/LPS O-acetylase OafA/YrhL